MVNTIKFSQFNAINKSGTNSLVGLSNGDNAISDFPLNWTTSTRPLAPTDGTLGYNTTLSLYEFWDAPSTTWRQLGTGDAGTVTQVDTGTGLTGGPITASGTISFAPIAANSFWANTTGGVAVPTVTSLANFLLSGNNLSDLTSFPTARANLGVAIGSDVEAWSATLDQIAGGIWAGATSITTLGTITTGVWHGSTVQVPWGGTGNTSFTAYSVICAGTTSTGAFQNVSGLGAAGQVLTSNGAGGLPTWQNTTGSGTVNSGLINQLAWYAASGTAVSGLATANNGVLITSAGGVPSISSTLPTAVQANITETGVVLTGTWHATPVELLYGGTNAALTANNGGIVYSNATQLQILLGTATANQVLLSGSSSAPSWSTATYPPTTTINQLLYSSAANTIVGLATTASATLITDGAGAPSISQTLPSAVQLNITTLGTVTTGTWNATTIDVPHGGTGNTTFTAYSLICAGTTATGAFQNVSGLGSSGQVLTSNGAGTLPTWQNVSGTGTVNSGTANDLAYYATTGNAVSALASANGGVLVTSNTGVPSILAGSGTTGTVLQATASGTPAWSTATYPATTTINQILYSSSANVIAGISSVNSAVLSTNGSGVPSFSTTLPSGLSATNLTLTTPALGTPASGTLTNCTDNRFSKAWANFNWNGSSIVINKSFNISSITHVGTGNYTVNFTNNMADANYAVCTGINSGSGTSAINATTLAVGSFKIFTFSGGAANDPTAIFFTVFD
jgi:hypothetical protein